MSKHRSKRNTGTLSTKCAGVANMAQPNKSNVWRPARVTQGQLRKQTRDKKKLRGDAPTYDHAHMYRPDRDYKPHVATSLRESQVLAYKLAELQAKYA